MQLTMLQIVTIKAYRQLSIW